MGSDGAHGANHEQGSIFYGIGVALATEAQRHMYEQLEDAWGEMIGEEGSQRQIVDLTSSDGLIDDAGSDEAGSRRREGMATDHHTVVAAARQRAAAERRANQSRGFQRVQETSDAMELATFAPSTTSLLDLVDLIVSHPDDTQWWRRVISRYIAAHPDEVYQHILRRIETRQARDHPTHAAAASWRRNLRTPRRTPRPQ